jgi:hypothetical protein
LTTSEYPPTSEELKNIENFKKGGNLFLKTTNDIIVAFKEMPLAMKQLIPVMFFPWYAYVLLLAVFDFSTFLITLWNLRPKHYFF